MILLHRIGHRYSSNWNTLSEIVDSVGPLSFDGVYTEVWEHFSRGDLEPLRGREIIFFVSGAYVGRDNSFDLKSGEKPGRFCTWEQVFTMAANLNAKVGYHGLEHRKCVGLTAGELITELAPPHKVPIRPLLAWPHGVADQLAIDTAMMFGYQDAWCAGPYGNGERFQRRRNYLNW